MIVNKPINGKYYIGHTTNTDDRFNASSGGIGTAITRFLLSQEDFGTALTFRFSVENKMYEPMFVHSAEEVNVCGSIYQDINIPHFIKENLSLVEGGLVVSCPPCQVAATKNILEKNNIRSFVISFCCSGQTVIEGTWKYYEFLGIDKDSVVDMQYRGKGWPSGIQISLSNGRTISHNNWTDPWITIHKSGFYRPKRCFKCILDSSYKSDISLADPWLKEYIGKDTVGNTLFFLNTVQGERVIEAMRSQRLIEYSLTDYNTYYTAQQPNVEKENRKRNQQREIQLDIKLTEKPAIRRYFTKSHSRMKSFLKLRNYILKLSTNKGRLGMISSAIRRIKNRLRYYYVAPKLGSHDGMFNQRGG